MTIKERESRIAYVARMRHDGMKFKDIAFIMNLSSVRVCQYYQAYVWRKRFEHEKETGEYISFEDFKKRLLSMYKEKELV